MGSNHALLTTAWYKCVCTAGSTWFWILKLITSSLYEREVLEAQRSEWLTGKEWDVIAFLFIFFTRLATNRNFKNTKEYKNVYFWSSSSFFKEDFKKKPSAPSVAWSKFLRRFLSPKSQSVLTSVVMTNATVSCLMVILQVDSLDQRMSGLTWNEEQSWMLYQRG